MFKTKADYSVNKKKYGGTCVDILNVVKPGSRVLDVGCATGKMACDLKKKKCTTIGIDIDEASLEGAKKYCEKTFHLDLDNLRAMKKCLRGRRFDAVVIGDVLEHLKYPGVVLHEMGRYLNGDGMIVATVPNTAFIWIRMKLLFGLFDYNPGGGLLDEDHLRFFTFKTAKILFEDAGYGSVSVRPSSHGIVNPRYQFMKYLGRLMPNLFSIHILVVAKKRVQKR